MPFQNILKYRLFYWFFAILIPLLAVNNSYFPFSGIAIAGIMLTIFSILAKPKVTTTDGIFALVAFVSALNFAVQTSSLTLFFSFVLWFYSSSWLVDKGTSKTINMFLPWIFSFFDIWGTKDTLPKLDFNFGPKYNTFVSRNMNQYLVNASIAVFVLLLIAPFLIMSNSYFGTFVNQNLEAIKSFLNTIFGNLGVFTIIQVFVFVFLVNFLPRQYLFLQKPDPVETSEKPEFSLLVAKCTVAVTLSIFLFAQVQTYLHPELLNLSAGKIANEVFFYLSVVCFVVFGLLYINLRHNFWAKITSIILLIQAFLLGLVAFNSDWSYVRDWGLTHKRLYGFFVLIIVLADIVIFIFYLISKNAKKFNLPIVLTTTFCVITAITNTINFDYLIYRNPPKESIGIERNYISTMSLDSYSLRSEYQKQYDESATLGEACINSSWLGLNYEKIKYLQNKYSTLQILGFSYNEYQNYQDVKDLKLPDYKDLWRINPNPTKSCYQRDRIHSTSYGSTDWD